MKYKLIQSKIRSMNLFLVLAVRRPFYKKYFEQKKKSNYRATIWKNRSFMEQWPSSSSIGFPIQMSHIQSHWVAPSSTQPFILQRLIKWVPGISENLVIKGKLPPQSGSSLEAVVNPIIKRGHKAVFFKV